MSCNVVFFPITFLLAFSAYVLYVTALNYHYESQVCYVVFVCKRFEWLLLDQSAISFLILIYRNNTPALSLGKKEKKEKK